MDVTPCLRVAQNVPLPPIKAGMDSRAVLARYRQALINANTNIDDTRACMAMLDRAEQEGYF